MHTLAKIGRRILSLGLLVAALATLGSRALIRDAAAQPPGALPAADSYLKAPNADANDAFGNAVALDGDTLAVAATGESSGTSNPADNSARSAGAVYVYVRVAGSWQFQAYLKAPNAEADDGFGRDLDLDGDTLVVGAPLEDSAARGVNGDQADNRAIQAGAAYVFVRANGAWTLHAYLKASNTEAHDMFGSSVAVDGDTIVVGAVGEDSAARTINGDQQNNTASGAGAAYVFVRTGTSWTQQAYLKAANADPGDGFFQVAIAGDTIAIGAVGDDSASADPNDNSAYEAGAAYVFARTGSAWTQQAYLKPSAPQRQQGFGGRLALDGDVLAVSAPSEAAPQPYAGAVYLFDRTGATWGQHARLTQPITTEHPGFGWAVALDGPTLVASASSLHCERWVNELPEPGCAPTSGAAYVWTRAAGSWEMRSLVTAARPAGTRTFGSALALDGTLLAVGMADEGSGGRISNGNPVAIPAPYAGAVYTFALPGAEPEVALTRADTGDPLPNGAAPPVWPAQLGWTAPGLPLTVTFRVHNLGAAPLDLGDGAPATLSGDPAGAFAIVAQPADPVPAGSRSALTIRFTPPAAGVYSATLRLASADADEPQYAAVLVGGGWAGRTYLPVVESRPPSIIIIPWLTPSGR
ncbi:MAG TPA: integrin [Herpetosiphonaceae bacterium]